jgi:hypothetical protein
LHSLKRVPDLPTNAFFAYGQSEGIPHIRLARGTLTISAEVVED